MKCLVLGAFGFLGSHLCDLLLERGHQVRLFDRFEASRGNVAHLLDQVELAIGDFGNAAAVSQALEGIDVVFHLICTTHPKVSNDDPGFDVASNLLPTLHLLDQAGRGGVRKVIFFSSGGTVYGTPQRTPIPEDHPTDPLCSYGIHKLAIEKYLHLYHHLCGLEYAVLRFANPFGERQRPDHTQGAVAVFTHKVLAGETIEVWGDGQVVRDYLYVRDAMDAAERAIACRAPVRVFNVGSGTGKSIREVIDAISRAVGRPARVVFEPARKLDVPVNILDCTAARQHLGWAPQFTFEQGLERMVTYERRVRGS
jgi:UDP-glucose 4-epimerase